MDADPRAMASARDDTASWLDALGLLDVLLTATRNSSDLRQAERRLSLMGCVTAVAATPGFDESGLGDPDGPAASLLLQCLSSGTEDYGWAAGACETAGLAPALLLCRAAAARPGQHYSPRMSLRPTPDDYRWLPVDELPPFHNPFKCDHKDDWARTAAPHRGPFRRLLRSPAGDPQLDGRRRADAWLAAEHHLWCSKHKPDLDWPRALAAAADVHARTRPWTYTTVYNAVNPTGHEPFTSDIAHDEPVH